MSEKSNKYHTKVLRADSAFATKSGVGSFIV